jgi:hypothetical protein
MSDTNAQLIAPTDVGVRGVLVPCEPSQFSDFIASLLGKKQSIDQRISGPFEANVTQIQNFAHLIDQRIRTQNKGNLIAFEGAITLDSDRTVILNSIADFDTFHPLDTSVTTSLNLSWSYLIHFPDKPIPEVQEINVSLVATPKSLSR